MEDIGKVMISAEEMPYWNNCEEISNRKVCTENKLSQYINKHLIYPKPALAEGTEGEVIISCIISKRGKVVRPNIISDIGSGCGEEALRIVTNMPLWNPAIDNESPVSVVYNIEVPFKLPKDFNVSESNNSDIIYEEPIKPIINKGGNIQNDSTPPTNEEKQFLPSNYTETNIGKVYTRVSQMPYFPGCEKIKNKSKEKRHCSNSNLVNFLSSSLVYPETAKAKSIEGIVYVSFIVDEKGAIVEPKVTRDIGGGCGEEALRVVSSMANWEPGEERGKPVKTQMNLPIRFFLSSGASDKYRIHWGALRSTNISESQVINSITEELVVRNRYGDDVTISTLNITYEKGNSAKEANSNGEITFEMMRLLRKVKAGGRLIFTATVQEKGELLDIYRVFDITK